MGRSNIEYCDMVWNPVTGCTADFQCWQRCWARQLSQRLANNPKFSAETRRRYGKSFTIGPQLWPERLDEPLKWRKPQTVFVCSQGDLFHEGVEWEWRTDIWKTMAACSRHTFLILTKRPKIMAETIEIIGDIKKQNEWFAWRMKKVQWPLPNVWLGVSVEDRAALPRMDILRNIPAAHRWVSFEPLLEDLGDVNYEGIDAVVVGGESGPSARPMHPDWARKVRDDCKGRCKFIFKQWGEWILETEMGLPEGAAEKEARLRELYGKVPLWQAGDWRYYFPGRDESAFLGAYYRIGKKNAGNVLDGVLHDDRPGKL